MKNDNITFEAAFEKLEAVLKEGTVANPPDRQFVSSTWRSMSLSWQKGWAVDARIEVDAVPHAEHRAGSGRFQLNVSVCWSSSATDPMKAIVAADLHTYVARIACLIQMHCDAMPPIVNR